MNEGTPRSEGMEGETSGRREGRRVELRVRKSRESGSQDNAS